MPAISSPTDDLAFILPDAACCELALELDRTFPAPATPQELTRRNHAASLIPRP